MRQAVKNGPGVPRHRVKGHTKVHNAGLIVYLGKRDCASALMRRGLRISQKSA